MTELLVPAQIQEALRHLWVVAPLFPIAISAWEKRILKEERSGDPNNSELEIDHIIPKYKGGADDISNCQALTRPEHAEKHLKAALEASSTNDRRAEFGAVRMIVGRMTEEERALFNREINE